MNNYEGVIFGGSGRLGSKILAASPRYLSPTRAAVDISDYRALESYLGEYLPKVVIHAAAVVGWLESEKDRSLTYRTNITGTENVVRACAKYNLRLVFISSVSVFDGDKGPYREEDIPNPAYFYGWTKLVGEQMVRLLPNYAIIRTDFYVPGSFKYPEAFVDHYCSKVPVVTLAREVDRVAKSQFTGVLNIGCGRDTLYNILKRTEKSIRGITIKDSQIPDFPRDLSLNTAKFKRLYAIGAI